LGRLGTSNKKRVGKKMGVKKRPQEGKKRSGVIDN